MKSFFLLFWMLLITQLIFCQNKKDFNSGTDSHIDIRDEMTMMRLRRIVGPDDFPFSNYGKLATVDVTYDKPFDDPIVKISPSLLSIFKELLPQEVLSKGNVTIYIPNLKFIQRPVWKMEVGCVIILYIDDGIDWNGRVRWYRNKKIQKDIMTRIESCKVSIYNPANFQDSIFFGSVYYEKLDKPSNKSFFSGLILDPSYVYP